MLLPCLAHAVSIGDIVLQSVLGEPLRAQVSLTLSKGERIDDACLSLASPDPREEDASGYLTKANLTLQTDGAQQYVVIQSRQSIDEAFVKLRLQVKCPGTGSVIKTLTALPDLDLFAARTETVGTEPSVVPTVTPVVSQPETARLPVEAPKAVAKKTARPAARHARAHAPRAMHGAQGSSANGPASFRLKLSGNPIDESRIGKISAEERTQLLARQKFLDTDDQMSSFLALQQQVKDLQAALGEVKLKLAPLNAAASSPQPALASAAKPPAAATKPPATQQTELPDGLLPALGLVLAILVLWLGFRYYTKAKSRPQGGTQRVPEPLLDFAVKATPVPSPPMRPSPSISPQPVIVAEPPKASAPAAAEVAAHQAEPEIPEDELMLEEAGLYASHGRPVKAIDILRHILEINPAKIEAWSLLLSIYSSLAKTGEFEETARAFLEHHKDHPSWSSIQALGRTLDGNNPLYTDAGGQAASEPSLELRRQVGDVLMEMGILSKQDLQRYLDDFDPKIHGRFGGYLVTRKAITLAQLDQALLLQQGVGTEAKPASPPPAGKPSDALPSLSNMEDFLANFDLQQNASTKEPAAAPAAEQPAEASRKNTPPDTINFEFPLLNLPETSPEPASGQPADKKPDTH